MPDTSENPLFDRLAALLYKQAAADERKPLSLFAHNYFKEITKKDLAGLSDADLCGLLLSHWRFAQTRPGTSTKIRVFNPSIQVHGWHSSHTVVEIVAPDRPFLVQSVIMEIDRRKLSSHRVIHPVFEVIRSSDGRLHDVMPTPTALDQCPESFIHIEIDRLSDAGVLADLSRSIERILTDLTAATDDWPRCKQRIETASRILRESAHTLPHEVVDETVAFLQWLTDDHFLFLGFREYAMERDDGRGRFRILPGTGLGILRDSLAPIPNAEPPLLTSDACAFVCRTTPLIITKTTSRATIRHPGFMDYVGIKRFGERGAVTGELRFIGFFTAAAYRADPRSIPLIRRTVDAAFRRSEFAPGSHNGRALEHAIQDLPKDELFQSNADALYRCAMGIVRLEEHRQIRIFLRQDVYGQFISVLVFVPRERYHTELRRTLTHILMETLEGISFEFRVQLSESALARVHFIIQTGPCNLRVIDVAALEHQFAQALRVWTDALKEALVNHFGEARGNRLFNDFRAGIPTAYQEDFTPHCSALDLDRIESLPHHGLALMLYQPPTEPAAVRFKLYCSDRPAALSDVLPMLERMGLRVLDEKPYEIRRASGRRCWIHDFGLQYNGGQAIEVIALKARFEETFENIWFGRIENDRFNQLVLATELDWRQITVLRALYFYLRQIGLAFSQLYVEQTLANNPTITTALVRLFETRFDPSNDRHTGNALGAAIETAIDAVASLDEDRILRRYLNLVQSIVRCNYYQERRDYRGIPYLSFKLDPAMIQGLPRPIPQFEIFVYSPRLEGVHLRAGAVARGGLRWSDRREDFRTEVLGLMKAQTTKNAIIVPTGAKGGFVTKRLQRMTGSVPRRREMARCYSIFIKGLLDLTDNIEDDTVVKPQRVVCYDDDDPYLVVAADKGTATLSDIANRIARKYRFWLGDAFASGGSTGYDHKKMGITARGAWESVKRHFIEMGTDIGTTTFTVIGIGDMSGDVFGNGMLQSDKIRLLGAFDHRHIFLDPNPDPAASLSERQRLFQCPQSSWDDYDRSRISAGGGVYSRSEKSIPLSDPVRSMLAVQAAHLTPDALIRALLTAPVDLLWNGGIGTYVKASDESNISVGDRGNDNVRVDANNLRCAVVVEGGNLGFTQRARIEFAAHGGRINTDSVDNSAGVDCSDHEVNIKIALDRLVHDGNLSHEQRNRLLEAMRDDVARSVLRNNALQALGLSLVEAEAAERLPLHRRLMQTLEQRGRLNRPLEVLPNDDTLRERAANGKGLYRPEIAVLMAYTKMALKSDLLSDSSESANDLPITPLQRYFPAPLLERYPQVPRTHRLRREIAANHLINNLVNRLGPSFPLRLIDETGAEVGDVVRAYCLILDLFDVESIWQQIEALETRIEAALQIDLMILVRRVMERAMYWLHRQQAAVHTEMRRQEQFRSGIVYLSGRILEWMPERERAFSQARIEQLVEAKVPPALAARVTTLNTLFSLLDAITVQIDTKRPLSDVARIHFALDQQLELSWLRAQISLLEEESYWHALARSAIRDEFHATCRALIEDVLECGSQGPRQLVRQWQQRRHTPLERYRTLLETVQTDAAVTFEKILVLLRALHVIVE